MSFPDGSADFRSDTVTRPTTEMRAAMAAAVVGDDVYGEDPTVNLLESEAAKAIGKEAALFVPSGTMGNQLAIGLQTRPGEELVCVEQSHLKNSETGAGGALWGIQFRTVPGLGGEITPERVRSLAGARGATRPRVRLLAWENTHNDSGGTVVDLGLIEQTSAVAKAQGWAVHLDGARIFNAAVASGRSAGEYAAVADTVGFCFSKGLGAPVGSVLCGTEELVKQARFLRRRLGGGMRQAGVLAAPARVALASWERLADDHLLAARMAKSLADRFPDAVELESVQTNMVLLHQRGVPFPLLRLVEECRGSRILLAPPSGGRLRLVTHRDVDAADVDRLLGIVDRLGT
ncbi:MAG TPA: GntG family PLP-dependent aldolase [Acidimicrobiia bacterium]